MLPVSGALQLKTSGARMLIPLSSAIVAYSTFESCCPSGAALGRNMFHNPRACRAVSGSQGRSSGRQHEPWLVP